MFAPREGRTKEYVYLVTMKADPSFQLELIEQELVRGQTFTDCESIILNSMSGGGDPPWWFIIAKRLYIELMNAEDISASVDCIILKIRSVVIYNRRTSETMYIRRAYRLKIATAMMSLYNHRGSEKYRNSNVSENIMRTALYHIQRGVSRINEN